MKLNSSKDIGALARQARRDQALTQLELAEHVGVSRDWIIHFERGKGSVELSLVLRTLKTLGLSLHAETTAAVDASEETAIDLDEILKHKG